MGFFSGLTRANQVLEAANAAQPLQPSTIATWEDQSALDRLVWSELYGKDATQHVSRTLAMSVGAVARGRHLLTGAISGCPLVGMKGAKPLADQPKFIRQPEAGRPRNVTLTWLVDMLIFHGRAFLEVTERYADGSVARFRWVPEWSAGVSTSGQLETAFGHPVAAGDGIRIDGPHEGILNFAAPRILEAVAVDSAAAKASDNPVPSVELHQTGGDQLSPEDRDKLIAGWVAARRGANGGVAFTNQSVEAKMHGIASEQLLIDGRNAAALNIARAMGLPAWAVDANVPGASLTYSNTPSRSRELIDYGSGPYMSAITGRLSLDDIMPAGQWCRFDTSSLLQPDFKTRMEGYKIAIETGVYSKEECRAIEEGTPLEEAGTNQ
ncbi:MAG: phage portal protein [Renibacterium salmoninarum]|nr:phage portal protein [Renibacterium salmoninarum]